MTGDGLGRGLSDMWRSVLLFVPAALAFAAILLAGYLVARLLRMAVIRGLDRAGLDRAVQRGAAARVFGAGGIGASELCGKIVFFGVLLAALQLAFGIWGPNPVSDLLTDLIAWLPQLVVAIVVVVVAAAVARATHELVAGALGGLAYGRLLARTASVVIIAFGVIAALDQVRIATWVTRPVLIAVLAAVTGVIVVGVGGGLIQPMRQRWGAWLDRAGVESAAIREHARAYAEERARTARRDPGDTQLIPAHSAETQLVTVLPGDEPGVTEETQAIPSPRGDEPGVTEQTQAIPAPRGDEPGVTEQTQAIPAPGEDEPGVAEETVAIPSPRQAGQAPGAGDGESTQVLKPVTPDDDDPPTAR